MIDAERIAQLEEEIAYLKAELGVQRNIDAIMALQSAFRLSAGQAVVLSALNQRRGRVLTNNQLSELALGDVTDRSRDASYLRVVVHRLRKKMGAGLIEHIGWGGDNSGYRLTAKGLQVVAEALEARRLAA